MVPAFTKRRAEQILDSGMTRLRFSLDAATAETYKKVRVGSIPLERVIRNIDYFLELKAKRNYKLPLVGVSFVKMSSNEHEVEQFSNFWKNKVDMVTIQRFMPPIVDLKKFKGYYSKDQIAEKPIQEFKCVQPFQRVLIRNDYIVPCCENFNKDLIIGSLKTSTIHKAWHSEKMNRIRDMHKRGEFYLEKTCNDCVNIMYPNHKIAKKANTHSSA